jgi:hypothetical protein
MDRRSLLASIGTGLSLLGGCLSASPQGRNADPTADPGGTPTDGPTAVPGDCPTSQDLDVEWPSRVDENSVTAFVERYERVYYREVVVEYEPESRLDEYELGGNVVSTVEKRDGGWVLEYQGGGAVYRPTLALGATTAEPPAAADVVPVSEIDDEQLSGMLEEAATTGEAEHHVEPPGEPVERYLEIFEGLSADFEGLSEPGDSATLHVDVDGTVVEVSVMADSFHGDYDWQAWYYVDDRVLRRTTDEDRDPRDGELLECRKAS